MNLFSFGGEGSPNAFSRANQVLTCNSRWRCFKVTPALFFCFFNKVSRESKQRRLLIPASEKSNLAKKSDISSPVCFSPSPSVGVVFIVCLSHCHSKVVTFTPEGQIQTLSPPLKKGRGLASKGQGMAVQVSHRCLTGVWRPFVTDWF